MPPDLADLFELHRPALYRYVRRMTGKPDTAEDLTQEVFLRACRRPPPPEQPGHDRAWLFTIARNLIIDSWRRQQQRPDQDSRRSLDELPKHGADPAARLVFEEAMAALPGPEREALLLREVWGFSYAEIAQITHATVDAVSARLYRARTALRSQLNDGDNT